MAAHLPPVYRFLGGLGAAVTQVEMLPRLLVREDPEVSEAVQRRFAAERGHGAAAVRAGHGFGDGVGDRTNLETGLLRLVDR